MSYHLIFSNVHGQSVRSIVPDFAYTYYPSGPVCLMMRSLRRPWTHLNPDSTISYEFHKTPLPCRPVPSRPIPFHPLPFYIPCPHKSQYNYVSLLFPVTIHHFTRNTFLPHQGGRRHDVITDSITIISLMLSNKTDSCVLPQVQRTSRQLRVNEITDVHHVPWTLYYEERPRGRPAIRWRDELDRYWKGAT